MKRNWRRKLRQFLFTNVVEKDDEIVTIRLDFYITED